MVSYHINLDDSSKEHPGWDESVICRDVDGSLLPWEPFNGRMSYHLSHTKDVESGKVFRRLQAMLDVVPRADTIHLDAFRCTNCSWEPDGVIGVMEELVCGVQPILAFFRQQGIDVTTESIDRTPIESAGLFRAIWHMDEPQIYHGKILGGGRGTDVLAFGLGTSFDIDLSFADLEREWAMMTDQIFLGSILYQFYLTREMTELRRSDRAGLVTLRFGDDVATHIDACRGHLRVTWGDVLVAEDGDRFVPLRDAIYACSTGGSERWWTLPDDWAGASLRLYSLTRSGRGTAPSNRRDGKKIWIHLEPRVPVKIVRDENMTGG